MNKNKYLQTFSARRKLLLASAASPALVWAGAVRAQVQSPKIARIGVLLSQSMAFHKAQIVTLRQALRDLGYVEGKNLVVELRYAENNYGRLNELATELVGLAVDVIVTAGTPSARAATQATTTVPIVMATIGDPVANGIVVSLARPGGNVTGSSMFSSEISAKRLELLKEAVPHMRRVGILLHPENHGTKKELVFAAQSLKLEVRPFGVRAPDEFDKAFSEMSKQRIDAVFIDEDGLFNANAKTIADTAAKRHLPSVGATAYAEAGGLIGYGVNILQMWRRATVFVDKILKGTNPRDLPIERPTTFDLVVNSKVAKALNVTIPQSIWVRATKVIE